MFLTMKDVYTYADLANWEAAVADLEQRPVLAVIGDPVAHSKSPQMHNPALDAAEIDGCYVRIHLSPDEVGDGLKRMADLGFIGTNVTIPHKAAALAASTSVGEIPRLMGSVNTLKFESDGMVSGWNTDGPGFVRAVSESLGVDVKDQRVAILGAGGGAGRGVSVQCAAEGCPRLVLINRSAEKVEALAEELGDVHPEGVEPIETCAWDHQALRNLLPNIDLVVNATSLGMKDGDPELLPADALRPEHRVYDMVYSGGETPLLAAARKVGAKGADGLPMLLHQGAISFEHWFGEGSANLEAMRAGLEG